MPNKSYKIPDKAQETVSEPAVAYRRSPVEAFLGEEKDTSLKKAVACLSGDYRKDKDLTAFTQLDIEDFYETR
jgi:hypothetical protein